MQSGHGCVATSMVEQNEAFLTDRPSVDGEAFDVDYGRNVLPTSIRWQMLRSSMFVVCHDSPSRRLASCPPRYRPSLPLPRASQCSPWAQELLSN